MSTRTRPTRRELLGQAAGAVAAGALTAPARAFAGPPADRGAGAPGAPRIAIVGAGLAGLTCALRLAQAGVPSTVYEAHDARIGGRCWTARGFPGGETAEHGGEFIDTAHVRIRALAAELGLHLDDVIALAARHPRHRPRWMFDGVPRTPAEVSGGSDLLARRATADGRRIGRLLWPDPTPAARALDEMTAAQWLERAVPGPEHALLRAVTRQYMSEEYGLDPERLSALNMIIQYGAAGPVSDERFHVQGGNDQIPHRVASRLAPGTVRLGHPLTGLRRRGAGYGLRFAGRRDEVIADLVVLCLPFPALRRVDLDGAGLTPDKRRCIEQLGMGTNAKLLLSFRRPLGDYDRFDGAYTDDEVDTWNSALGEGDRAGLLTVFSGGAYGAGYRVARPHGPAPGRIVDPELARLDRAVPGLRAGFDGTAWLDHWVADPWTHGSYAAYLPGQVTRWLGFVGRPEQGVHFGGEHTCVTALGYLEGAVRSGERCAREVVARVR